MTQGKQFAEALCFTVSPTRTSVPQSLHVFYRATDHSRQFMDA